MEWPEALSSVDGQSFTPRDIFGNKLEALNKLRMQDKVWITLLLSNPGNWQVEIAGYDIRDVEAAKEHFTTMITKMRADTFGVQHAYNLILDWLEGMTVELQQCEGWWPNYTNRVVVPRLLPSIMMDDPGSSRRNLYSVQMSGLKHAIKASLENVRHRQGTYDFAVRLGSLAISTRDIGDDKIGKTYSRETFLKDIDGSVKLQIKKW